MGSLTRGPLPSSVYWRRRLIILTIALLLVVGIAKLLGGGSDGRSDGAAAQVSSTTGATVTVTAPGPVASSSAPLRHPSRATHSAPVVPTTSVPPTPTGACAPSDIVAVPTVTGAYAGSPVTIVLQLRTRTTPACTWRVTKDAIQVRIARAGLRVWSTSLCPHAVPTADVVVRRDTTSTLALSWDGHLSDQNCSVHTPWATAGPYTIVAAALGGEPSQTSFTLARPTVTPPASPTTTPTTAPATTGSVTPTATPTTTPATTPSPTASSSR